MQGKPRLVTSMAATPAWSSAAAGDLTPTATNGITLLPPAWQGNKQNGPNEQVTQHWEKNSLLQIHLYFTKIKPVANGTYWLINCSDI